ncbi:guanine nucleotide-binding protein subunit gamma 2-like [Lotus japonicus]|uniref:G protein gamma domain-containing protein n=1 Tax=Lotus japonicus TaxID=34305 RepID=I3SQN8_LOTJA|nr:guanine nucleotide-binding protein subunit gamma 2-like [Lotus japonicus]AFK42580.1 unknown [Lotus japonicus]
MAGHQSSEAENGRESSEDCRERDPAHPLSQTAFYGKHRLQAAISQLNNQISIMEEELKQLETIGESSIVCKDVISSVESIPDPLLPFTKGSMDAGWDRWFGGAHNSRNNHKRWV